jgi:two-component system nitrate/nitrite response regulator NarL
MAGAAVLSAGSLHLSTPSRATPTGRTTRDSHAPPAGVYDDIDQRPASTDNPPDRGDPETVRLVLIDAPTLSRCCLAAYLERRRGLHLVADAGTGEAGLALVQSLKPDVVIVEPSVANGGTELIAQLSQAVPGGLVITLIDRAGLAGAVSVSEALHAGTRAYLEKYCEPEDLIQAIERVRLGEILVSAKPEAAGHEAPAGASARPDGPPLTNREREVVRLVAEGRTNADIARAMCITLHTAKGYLAQILRKLALDNRVQLATFALQQGLGPSAVSESDRQ